MSWFNKTIKNFGGAKSSQGTDGSNEYLNNHQVRFILYQYNSGAMVSLKPYIKSYDLKFSTPLTDETKDYFLLPNNNKFFTTESLSVDFSLSIEVLAHSVNEALVNIQRINEIDRMYKSVIIEPKGTNTLLRNIYCVYLSNLFCGEKNGGIAEPDGRDGIISQGVPCFLDKFSFSIDKELGMFEYAGDLLPKKYTLNFSFKVSNAAHYELTSFYLWMPLNEYGDRINSHEDMGFPFGDHTAYQGSWVVSGKGTDGSKEWSDTHDAMIYIASGALEESGGDPSNYSKKPYISFKPFLDSFNWDYSREDLSIKEVLKVGGGLQTVGGSGKTRIQNKIKFSVLSHSINEARENMAKVNYLVRMCDQFFPVFDPETEEARWPQTSKAKATQLYFKFNNINSKSKIYRSGGDDTPRIDSYKELNDRAKLYILKSFSVDIDFSMGMFEYGNMLMFKKFDLSFDLFQVGRNEGPYRMYIGDSEFVRKKTKDKPNKRPDRSSRKATNHKIFK